jgi:hypothetical protein
MRQIATQITRRLLHILGTGLLLVALAACAGNAQDDYYDDDVGSPSQGAPLDGGAKEVEDFEHSE